MRRLALIAAARQVLVNALAILGVSAPESDVGSGWSRRITSAAAAGARDFPGGSAC